MDAVRGSDAFKHILANGAQPVEVACGGGLFGKVSGIELRHIGDPGNGPGERFSIRLIIDDSVFPVSDDLPGSAPVAADDGNASQQGLNGHQRLAFVPQTREDQRPGFRQVSVDVLRPQPSCDHRLRVGGADRIRLRTIAHEDGRHAGAAGGLRKDHAALFAGQAPDEDEIAVACGPDGRASGRHRVGQVVKARVGRQIGGHRLTLRLGDIGDVLQAARKTPRPARHRAPGKAPDLVHCEPGVAVRDATTGRKRHSGADLSSAVVKESAIGTSEKIFVHGIQNRRRALGQHWPDRGRQGLGPAMTKHDRPTCIETGDFIGQFPGRSPVPEAGYHCAKPAGIVEQRMLSQTGDRDAGMLEKGVNRTGRREEADLDPRIGQQACGVDRHLGLAAVQIGEIADDQSLGHQSRHVWPSGCGWGNDPLIEHLDQPVESVNSVAPSIWLEDLGAPDLHMTKPKVLFVANGVLGWSTYARQFEAVATTRTDIDLTVLHRKPGRLTMQFARRHADGPIARHLRPFDPISLYGGRLGRDIRAVVASVRPDVVHVAAHWPAGALAQLDTPFTIALDATRAGIGRDLQLPGWTAKEMATEARLCRTAAHLFPMSDWVAGSLLDDYGVEPGKITVQPPSLIFDTWPGRAEGANAVPQVLFVGNDLSRKGAHRLADWVEGPLAGRCHLHVVSTDRSAPPSGPNITFHGRVPHARLLTEMMPKADIFCLPTRLDMSPFVLAEAAAAGLPVVASLLGGIPGLVENGQTGLLVPQDDDKGFVRALERLIADAGLRRRMSDMARSRAREQFDGTRNFNLLIEQLVEIAGTGAVAE